MNTRIGSGPLRLPISLKNVVAEASPRDNTSIDQFVVVVVAVAERPSAMKTAERFAERRGNADPEAAISILSRDGGLPPHPEDRLRVSDSRGES